MNKSLPERNYLINVNVNISIQYNMWSNRNILSSNYTAEDKFEVHMIYERITE